MATTETHHEPTGHELERAEHDAGGGGHPGGHDEHHDGEALGPIDVAAWGALVLGSLAGLLVAACLVVSVGS
jgi:hypothetical protein